ncbi:MAG: RNA polymerase subunit sigma-70, partial [Bacteroidetes bacterium]|nr:RNA polymerase subunit sigma-70 [Bacteroidota bacterium]
MKGLNEKEFLDLVTKHQNIIHKVCNMFASDEQDRHDLFQEITIKLWMGY